MSKWSLLAAFFRKSVMFTYHKRRSPERLVRSHRPCIPCKPDHRTRHSQGDKLQISRKLQAYGIYDINTISILDCNNAANLKSKTVVLCWCDDFRIAHKINCTFTTSVITVSLFWSICHGGGSHKMVLKNLSRSLKY